MIWLLTAVPLSLVAGLLWVGACYAIWFHGPEGQDWLNEKWRAENENFRKRQKADYER